MLPTLISQLSVTPMHFMHIASFPAQFWVASLIPRLISKAGLKSGDWAC